MKSIEMIRGITMKAIFKAILAYNIPVVEIN